MSTSRSLLLAVVVFVGGLGAGCPPDEPLTVELPGGVPVEDLPADQRALLRVTMAVDDGVLDETDLVLSDTRLSGDVNLNNVAEDGDHTARLRLYGRSAADSGEVLLGEATKTVTLFKQGASRITWGKGDTFETCDAASGNPGCAVRFDVNRNGDANLVDLLPVDKGGRGIDPAPQAPFLDVAPATLQFPSGIQVGSFARQVIVVENTGKNPVRVLRAEVVAAPGAGLALFDRNGEPTQAARRVLDATLFDGVIAPTEEQLIATSFAPANAFFTTGAVHVVVEDTVTGVRQTARVKLIGNPDGVLRVRAEGDNDANEFAGDADVPVFTYPLDRLLSGLPTSSDDPAVDGAGLPLVQGTVAGIVADVAWLVEVPGGQRLSASLAGLDSDIDLAVVALGDGDAVVGDACLAAPSLGASCRSQNAGTSPEGIDLQNDSLDTLRLLLLLTRIDLGGEGARVPFELTLLRTDAPSFVDEQPINPATGPLEGGVRVTLIGRGFDDGASVLIGGARGLDVEIGNDPTTRLSTATLTLPPGSLDPGRNPATIVVQNPSVADGGDGQAAVLPDGFIYQPPAPRLDALAPGVASSGINTAPVQLIGAFFSSRFGAPVVFFDDAAVDSTFVDPSRIEVVPPSDHAAGTVFVTVRNHLSADPDDLSAPSPARPFRFVLATGPAPLITALTPDNATVDGGEEVVLTGTGFADDVTVFLGGVAVPVVRESAGRVVLTIPPRVVGGRVDVVVANGDGQATVLRGGFNYVVPEPAISDVFPTRASTSGGAIVIVNGTGFRPGARARFVDGDVSVAAGSTSVVSSRVVLATAPVLVAGTYDVVIDNLDGTTASLQDDGGAGFAVFQPSGPAPVGLALDPASGGTAGGTPITWFGRNLSDITVVIGATVLDADDVELVPGAAGEPDEVRFIAPPQSAAGVVVIQVINGDGQTASLAYSYVQNGESTPRLDDLAPARITGTRSVVLTIHGANIVAGASVLVGGLPVAATFVGAGVGNVANNNVVTITCIVPPRPAGSVAVTLTNPDGQQASFPLEITGPPVIAGLSTSSVHALVPGDQVIVIGDALDVDPIGSVIISGSGGDESATVVESANGFLVVEVPGLPGFDDWAVQVDYAGGEQVVSAQTFTAVEPTVESITPVSISGVVLLEVRGDALNPDHFDAVLLEAAGGLSSTCAPLSRSETRVLCRPDPALVPGTDYGASLGWEGTFDGESVPVSLPALFVGTEEPVVVTGVTLAVGGVDRVLPASQSLLGVEVGFTVPGAVLLPGLVAIVDGNTVLGDVTDVVGDLLVVTCRNVSLTPGSHPVVIRDGGGDYAVGGTLIAEAAAAAALTPATLTWPGGFSASGSFGANDTVTAVRVEDPTLTRDLPTRVFGTTAQVRETGALSTGQWIICSTTAAASPPCAGPVLTVTGPAEELEGLVTAIEPGAAVTGTFDAGPDTWFFFAEAGDPIVVAIDAAVNAEGACGAGTTLALSKRDGRALASAVNIAGSCHVGVAVTAPETGEYEVVTSTLADAGGYGLAITTAPVESEPNDDVAEALEVIDGGAVASGTLSPSTDVDLWSFSLSTPQTVSVALDVFPSCAVPMRLAVRRKIDGSGVSLEAPTSPGACPSTTTGLLPPGTYEISVSQAPGQATTPSYTLTFESSVCGDGVVAGAEACDDGRNDGGDGCDADCATEGAALCTGAPSKCVLDVLFVDTFEGGTNGWTVDGLVEWSQVPSQGDVAWEWSLGSDGNPSVSLIVDGTLVSPAIDLGGVRPGDPVFVSLVHKDDGLVADATVHVEVLSATGSQTPPGAIEPLGGYPNGDAWGCCTVNTGFVRDIFDLSPWAGATSLTLGFVAHGVSQDATVITWQVDDLSVVGTTSGPVVPGAWSCSPSFYGTGDGCDCGCGAVDLDCAGQTAASCDYCDNTGSCNDGSGCPGLIDANTNFTCSAP